MKVRFVRAVWFTPLFIAALFALSRPGHAQKPAPPILGYFLILDGEPAGWMYAVEDNGVEAEVISDKSGDDGFVRKRIGNIKYTDIKVTVGAEMGKNFYNWIQQSFDKGRAKEIRKSGSIIAADFNYRAVLTIEFKNALITEVGFPALDARSKGDARLFVRFQPDQRTANPSPGPINAPAFKQKAWLASNFRISIDGLEKPCSRVNKVEALTIKQKIVNGQLERDASDLCFTLPAADSDPLRPWFADFLLNSNSGENQERSATLDYLAPDGATLFTLSLPRIGPFQAAWQLPLPGEEAIPRYQKCCCYCNGGYVTSAIP